MPNNAKPFNEVNIGDVAIDYFGDKGKVVKKGKIGDLSKDCTKEELKEWGYELSSPAILVKMDEIAEPIAFIYDTDGGAYVEN